MGKAPWERRFPTAPPQFWHLTSDFILFPFLAPCRGARSSHPIEDWTINRVEAVKACCNAVRDPPLHFFRAPDGLEVDLPMEDAGKLCPVEIKAAQTYHPSMGRNLCRFDAIAGEVERPTVVYAGRSVPSSEFSPPPHGSGRIGSHGHTCLAPEMGIIRHDFTTVDQSGGGDYGIGELQPAAGAKGNRFANQFRIGSHEIEDFELGEEFGERLGLVIRQSRVGQEFQLADDTDGQKVRFFHEGADGGIPRKQLDDGVRVQEIALTILRASAAGRSRDPPARSAVRQPRRSRICAVFPHAPRA